MILVFFAKINVAVCMFCGIILIKKGSFVGVERKNASHACDSAGDKTVYNKNFLTGSEVSGLHFYNCLCNHFTVSCDLNHSLWIFSHFRIIASLL